MADILSTSSRKLVVIESPYRGNGYTSLELNLKYGRACMRDSFLRGEFPIASHLLYTQEGILDDKNPSERMLGIEAGLAWANMAHMSAVYLDLISDWHYFVGIAYGVKRAREVQRPVEFRNLPEGVLVQLDSASLLRRKPNDVLVAELEQFIPTLRLT